MTTYDIVLTLAMVICGKIVYEISKWFIKRKLNK